MSNTNPRLSRVARIAAHLAPVCPATKKALASLTAPMSFSSSSCCPLYASATVSPSSPAASASAVATAAAAAAADADADALSARLSRDGVVVIKNVYTPADG